MSSSRIMCLLQSLSNFPSARGIGRKTAGKSPSSSTSPLSQSHPGARGLSGDRKNPLHKKPAGVSQSVKSSQAPSIPPLSGLLHSSSSSKNACSGTEVPEMGRIFKKHTERGEGGGCMVIKIKRRRGELLSVPSRPFKKRRGGKLSCNAN